MNEPEKLRAFVEGLATGLLVAAILGLVSWVAYMLVTVTLMGF